MAMTIKYVPLKSIFDGDEYQHSYILCKATIGEPQRQGVATDQAASSSRVSLVSITVGDKHNFISF